MVLGNVVINNNSTYCSFLAKKGEGMKEKYPIPKYCKKDCLFRDKKAKYMPACQYYSIVKVEGNCDNLNNGIDDRVCKTYKNA